jgi:hypothetical protein
MPQKSLPCPIPSLRSYGAYPIIKRILFPRSDGTDIGVFRKWLCGVMTGGFGAALANPSDLVKIRMQAEAGRIGADGRLETGLHAGQRPKYRNGFQALWMLARHEGLRAMYAGTSATAARAAMGTGAQVASYDHTKYLCKRYGLAEEGTALHLFGAVVAGLFFSTFAAPADVVKSRYMAEAHRFRNPLDCLKQLVVQEGPSALFRGWSASAVRIVPLFMVMTPILERVRHAIGLGWYAT